MPRAPREEIGVPTEVEQFSGDEGRHYLDVDDVLESDHASEAAAAPSSCIQVRLRAMHGYIIMLKEEWSLGYDI